MVYFKKYNYSQRRITLKKISLMLLAILSCLTLSSCTALINFDANALMSPPKAEDDSEAVHTLMQQDSAQLTFVYPKSGDHRSAIIIREQSSFPTEYSIGFSTNIDGGVNLKFMIKNGEEWEIVQTFQNLATQVDRVYFADMNGDGSEEVIVGWGSPQSMTATISIFTFSANKVLEYPLSENYNEIALTDFDDDNVSELFFATIFTEAQEQEGKDKQSVGKLYTLKNNSLNQAYSVELSSSVTRYSQSLFSPISSDQNALILDGTMADNSMISQVITIDNGSMVNSLATEEASKLNYFYRPPTVSYTSRDIDNDGIIEFPVSSLQSVYEDSDKLSSYSYYIDWVKFDSQTLTTSLVLSTIINTDGNYFITLPQDHPFEVFCTADTTVPHKLNFYHNDSAHNQTMIFSIDYFSLTEWEEFEDEFAQSYVVLLQTQDEMVYAGQLHSNYPGVSDIMNSLELLS